MGQTVEGVLNVIANHTHFPENEPVMSCHARTGREIGRSHDIMADDEIVLLSSAKMNDRVYHSIILSSDGEMKYDSLAGETDIPTYDPETGIYDTKKTYEDGTGVFLESVWTISIQDMMDGYDISTHAEPIHDHYGNDEPPEP